MQFAGHADRRRLALRVQDVRLACCRSADRSGGGPRQSRSAPPQTTWRQRPPPMGRTGSTTAPGKGVKNRSPNPVTMPPHCRSVVKSRKRAPRSSYSSSKARSSEGTNTMASLRFRQRGSTRYVAGPSTTGSAIKNSRNPLQQRTKNLPHRTTKLSTVFCSRRSSRRKRICRLHPPQPVERGAMLDRKPLWAGRWIRRCRSRRPDVADPSAFPDCRRSLWLSWPMRHPGKQLRPGRPEATPPATVCVNSTRALRVLQHERQPFLGILGSSGT